MKGFARKLFLVALVFAMALAVGGTVYAATGGNVGPPVLSVAQAPAIGPSITVKVVEVGEVYRALAIPIAGIGFLTVLQILLMYMIKKRDGIAIAGTLQTTAKISKSGTRPRPKSKPKPTESQAPAGVSTA